MMINGEKSKYILRNEGSCVQPRLRKTNDHELGEAVALLIKESLFLFSTFGFFLGWAAFSASPLALIASLPSALWSLDWGEEESQ